MDEKFNRIPVSVIHFDKDGTVTDVEDYNLDKVEPDLRALKGLAAALLPVIREFYTHEDHVHHSVRSVPAVNFDIHFQKIPLPQIDGKVKSKLLHS